MTKGGGPPLEFGESQLVRIVSNTIRIGPPCLPWTYYNYMLHDYEIYILVLNTARTTFTKYFFMMSR